MAEFQTNAAAPAGAEGPNDAALAKKADEAQAAALAAAEGTDPKAAEANKPAIPEWVPEKFRSAEDPMKAMADAYAELEGKLGAKKDEPAKADEKKPEGTEADDAANQAVEQAGLKMEELSAEFEKEGKLADASYEKLEKAGIPRAMVDAYIEGIKAVSEKAIGEVVGSIGGQENFDAMAQWASQNLDAKELEAYNKATTSDVATAKLAVQGVWAKYQEANGQDPKLIKGGTAINTGAEGYESMAQMTADMKNPLYQKDPAFRAKVEQKVKNSKAF